MGIPTVFIYRWYIQHQIHYNSMAAAENKNENFMVNKIRESQCDSFVEIA